MSRPGGGDLAAGVVGAVATVGLMAGVVLLAVGRAPAPHAPHAEAGRAAIVPATRPIPAEADVFRTRPAEFGADPDPALAVRAHRRTLEVHHLLRAFPGAPPRIPHGLTNEEFRGALCTQCHARGGYVERFATYAPVTPHPELGQCLECHVADDRLVGRPLSFNDGTPVCAQCHILDALTAPPPVFVAIDWPTPKWLALPKADLPGAPPPIPHRLQFRGNCVACHGGLGAVYEVRTSHPERANCRQCHLREEEDAEPFARPAPDAGSAGGTP